MRTSIRMERVKPSAIRSVQKRIVEKPGVISFAAGLPSPKLFPLEDLQAATASMMEESGTVALQYGLTIYIHKKAVYLKHRLLCLLC